MSRRKPPRVIEAEVPEQYWDTEPLVSNRSSSSRRPKISPEARAAVYERDNYRCRICASTEDLTIDHVKPLSKGGSNKRSNMQTLCRDCNQDKGDGKAVPRSRSAAKPPRERSRLAWAYEVLLGPDWRQVLGASRPSSP